MTIREWDEMRLQRDIEWELHRGEVIFTTKTGEEIRGAEHDVPSLREALYRRARAFDVKHNGSAPVGRPPSRGARKPDLSMLDERQRSEPDFGTGILRVPYTNSYDYRFPAQTLRRNVRRSGRYA
jgi:hypothetical protein